VKIKSITDSLFRYGTLLIGLGIFSSSKHVGTHIGISISILVFAALFLFIGLGFYWYFAIKAPDYLRSETYQLRKQSLELLGDKDNHDNPNLDKIELITSPYDDLSNGDNEKKELDEPK